VNHASVAFIEKSEGAAVAVLRGLYQRDLGAAGLGWGVHGCETWEGGLQLKFGCHVEAIAVCGSSQWIDAGDRAGVNNTLPWAELQQFTGAGEGYQISVLRDQEAER
jgi:hypothetical protein